MHPPVELKPFGFQVFRAKQVPVDRMRRLNQQWSFKVTIELNLFVNRVLVFSDVLVHDRRRCQMLARPGPLA